MVQNPSRRRSLVLALVEWARAHLLAEPNVSPPVVGVVSGNIVGRVLIEGAHLLFVEQEGTWLTVDLIVGTGRTSSPGFECEVPRGEPVTLQLEIDAGAPKQLIAERVAMLESWSRADVPLRVEVTTFVDGPGRTRLVVSGGGRHLDVSFVPRVAATRPEC